jgi:hypothetical protein
MPVSSAAKAKILVYGLEQLLGIRVRHLDFVGGVFAELARHVAQALPGICFLAETQRNQDDIRKANAKHPHRAERSS